MFIPQKYQMIYISDSFCPKLYDISEYKEVEPGTLLSIVAVGWRKGS